MQWPVFCNIVLMVYGFTAGDHGTRRYFKEREGAGGGETEAEAYPLSAVPRTFTWRRITADSTDPWINI